MERSMTTLDLAYQASTHSTGIQGRAICNARHHHWIADDSGGEALGAGELFCSSLSACAVNMVERIAHQEERGLDWMAVHVEAYRDPTQPPGQKPGGLTLYDAIRVRFEMWGVSEEDAGYLVGAWKER